MPRRKQPVSENPMLAALEKRRQTLEYRFMEAEIKAAEKLFEMDDLWSRYVPPQTPFYTDRDGSGWMMLETDDEENQVQGFANESQLKVERSKSRHLCLTNGFAINAIENRVSYAVGSGIKIKAAARNNGPGPAPEAVQAIVKKVQDVIDFTFKANNGFARQQETMRRRDRDGEAFRRLFVMRDNSIRVRSIEPASVDSKNKDHRNAAEFRNMPEKRTTWGIVTEAKDVETPIAYLTNIGPIDAAEVLHSKANVDLNVKRGVPTLYPVAESLQWAYEVVRRASKLTAIQASIAIIRRINKASHAQAGTFIAAQSMATKRYSPTTDKDVNRIPVREGTIYDVNENVDLEFPAAKINSANFSVVVQMILRLSASRMTMPEWMFTSDASNANYSNSMVAEGPATKSFQRLQSELGEPEIEIARRAVNLQAQRIPGIPVDWESLIELTAVPPRVETQNNLEEAKVDQIDLWNQILSPQTRAQRRGLNYDTEQDNIDEFMKKKAKRDALQPQGNPQPQGAQPEQRNGKPQPRRA